MKKPGIKYWIIDNTTLEKLQVLKQFVDFVAGLEETSPEHKNNAEKVKFFIENLDKPETFVDNWNTCIDIYNTIIQSGGYGHNYEENKGLYWKRWWIWFEMEELQVNIVEEYADKMGHQDEKWIFDCCIRFKKDAPFEGINGDTNFNEFVEDALNFRKYITEDLDYIETGIDI